MLFPYGEKLQFKTLTMSQCSFHQEGNNITVSDLISGDRVEVEVIYTATGPYMGLNYVNTSVLTVPFFFFESPYL